jgi:hypothetical protein
MTDHEKRVAEMVAGANAVFERERKKPTEGGCIAFVTAAFDADWLAFRSGAAWFNSPSAGPGETPPLVRWWLMPTLDGKVPSRLLRTRRGRKRLIEFADKVMADKRQRDKEAALKATFRRLRAA